MAIPPTGRRIHQRINRTLVCNIRNWYNEGVKFRNYLLPAFRSEVGRLLRSEMEAFVRAVIATEPRIDAHTMWIAVDNRTLIFSPRLPGKKFYGRHFLKAVAENHHWVFIPRINTVFYRKAES